MEPCGAVRVDGLQFCQQRADALLLQPLLQALPGHTAGASGGKVRAADQGLQIQPRAAHQNRAAAPAEDILHAGVGLRYEPGHGPALGGIGHAHHVVGDALHLLRSGGGGADGHAPIDLHGVHGHHLAAEAAGQRHAHFCFSCGGGTHHADDLWDHRGTPFPIVLSSFAAGGALSRLLRKVGRRRQRSTYALLNIFSISYLLSFTATGRPWGQ